MIKDLKAGRIGSMDLFRWRLAMAVHGPLEAGVRLGDVWEAWAAGVPDPGALLGHLGWAPESAHFLDRYRDNDARMSFPTVEEMAAAMAPQFRLQSCTFPSYELGDRCPTPCFARE